mmetsp:Transcript_16846/g.40081  ORF Transcript_16846/g.40081 Transcript_16846/m.40081 type:complete len:268 (+) Transcript_16846:387-1190(+)
MVPSHALWCKTNEPTYFCAYTVIPVCEVSTDTGKVLQDTLSASPHLSFSDSAAGTRTGVAVPAEMEGVISHNYRTSCATTPSPTKKSAHGEQPMPPRPSLNLHRANSAPPSALLPATALSSLRLREQQGCAVRGEVSASDSCMVTSRQPMSPLRVPAPTPVTRRVVQRCPIHTRCRYVLCGCPGHATCALRAKRAPAMNRAQWRDTGLHSFAWLRGSTLLLARQKHRRTEGWTNRAPSADIPGTHPGPVLQNRDHTGRATWWKSLSA